MSDLSSLSDAELLALAQQHLAKPPMRAPDALDNPNMATEGMSGTDKFLAGAGKAFTDLGRGAKQLTLGNTPETQAEIDAAKTRDAPLMNTGAGVAGNIAGGVAAALPTVFIPGVNTYTGAAALGAGLGALSPTATGESRTKNALVGALSGVGGQALGNGIGRVISPVQSRLGPEEAKLAAAAGAEGIPLSAADRTGSRPLKIVESVMENLPLTSASQLANRETQQRAFTQAALRRAGINSDVADAASLAAKKSDLGQVFEDISSRNNLNFSTNDLTGKLAAIADDAGSHLPPDAVAKVQGTVDKILSQVGQGDLMSGSNYQGWRTPLFNLAKKGDETSLYFGQMKKALDSEFDSQVSGADGAGWKQASREYANLKTLMQAVGGAGDAAAVGQIAPAQLRAALTQSIGKEGRALWRGDLNELSRVGQIFVRDKIPNSGTAQRQLIQSLLTTGAGSGVGGIAAGASGHDPLQGMAYGAGVGGAALAAPKLVQSLMNSGAGQRYLSNTAVSPATQKAIAAALRTALIGGTMAAQ